MSSKKKCSFCGKIIDVNYYTLLGFFRKKYFHNSCYEERQSDINLNKRNVRRYWY